MFCTKCGSHNLDEANICRNCSAPLVRREIRTAPLPPPPRTNEPPKFGSVSPPPYSDPPRPVGQPGYGSVGSGPPPPNYQPHQPQQGYQSYQSASAPYAPPMPQGASGRAIASMILSIVSLVAACGPFTSIPGMILGKMEMNAIRAGQAPPAGETFAKIGFHLGLVVTILFGSALVIGLFAALLGMLNN